MITPFRGGRPQAWRVATVGAVGFLIISSFWFDSPIVFGNLVIRQLLAREALVIGAVVGVWILAAGSLRADVQSARSHIDLPGPASRLGWLVPMIVGSVCVFYFPILISDAPPFDSYFARLGDRPWLLFLPSHLWRIGEVESAYRPLGLMFTGLIVRSGPAFALASGVILQAVNAALVARLAARLWPGDRTTIFLAGLFAGIWPQLVGTVAMPINHPYLVCGAFYLIALIVFDEGLRRAEWTWIAGALTLQLAAFLSLEFAVTLPFVVTGCAIATRSWRRAPRFAISAVAMAFLLAAVCGASYAAYLSYAHASGQTTKVPLLFPLNVKHAVVSLGYLPFWSFAFPYELFGAQHALSHTQWLVPVLCVPIVVAVAYKVWRDPGIRFSVMAASVAVAPAANMLDLSSWGNERYVYLAFLLLCSAYARIVALLVRSGGSVTARWTRGVAAAALVGSIVTLGQERVLVFARDLAAPGKLASAVAMRIPDPDRVGRVLVVDEETVYCAEAVFQLRVAETRPRQLVRVTGHGCPDPIVLRETSAGGRRVVDVEWRESSVMPAGGRRGVDAGNELVFLWDDGGGQFAEVAARVRERYAEVSDKTLEQKTVRVDRGLIATRDGEWRQPGLDGALRIDVVSAQPSVRDRLQFQLAVRPIGVSNAPSQEMSQLTLEWAVHDGRRARARIPVIPDGKETEYHVHIGSRIGWLTADPLDRISLRMPGFPLDLRFSPSERIVRGPSPEP